MTKDDIRWLANVLSRHKATGYQQTPETVLRDFTGYGYFCISPSIKKDLEWLYLERKYGLELVSESDIEYRNGAPCRVDIFLFYQNQVKIPKSLKNNG